MWSEGVKLTEKDELENVDKAVISGTQRVSASVLHVYYEASGTIEFGLTTFGVFLFFFTFLLYQLCEYCKRLGATIRCHAEGCSRFYHFPCSAASGSFQSMKQSFLLCPEHIDKAEELGKGTGGICTFLSVVVVGFLCLWVINK